MKAFEKLLAAETVEEVNKILDDLNILKKNRMDVDTYPPLEFKITKEEVEALKENKHITGDNLVGDVRGSDPLTRLLYSVLWKNGDLKKVRHIVEGLISGEEDDKEKGLVFYQFGKYLTKRVGEPIIDQHVLRAFGIYLANGDTPKIEKLQKKSVITKSDGGLIKQYKCWLRNNLQLKFRENLDYTYHVDRVLFAIGKSVKIS